MKGSPPTNAKASAADRRLKSNALSVIKYRIGSLAQVPLREVFWSNQQRLCADRHRIGAKSSQRAGG